MYKRQKLDMPEFDIELDAQQPRKLEIFDEDRDEWYRCTLERAAVDGRLFLRFEGEVDDARWMDLTKCRYRWVLEPQTTRGGSSAELLEGSGGEATAPSRL